MQFCWFLFLVFFGGWERRRGEDGEGRELFVNDVFRAEFLPMTKQTNIKSERINELIRS